MGMPRSRPGGRRWGLGLRKSGRPGWTRKRGTLAHERRLDSLTARRCGGIQGPVRDRCLERGWPSWGPGWCVGAGAGLVRPGPGRAVAPPGKVVPVPSPPEVAVSPLQRADPLRARVTVAWGWEGPGEADGPYTRSLKGGDGCFPPRSQFEHLCSRLCPPRADVGAVTAGATQPRPGQPSRWEGTSSGGGSGRPAGPPARPPPLRAPQGAISLIPVCSSAKWDCRASRGVAGV